MNLHRRSQDSAGDVLVEHRFVPPRPPCPPRWRVSREQTPSHAPCL
jgi:hypothetical protein